jgi:thioredoxin-like negative regulator of GroEL
MASKDFNYQVALKEGLKSLEQGRLRQAEQSFKYLVDKFPGAEGGYRGLAKVHFEEEDRAGALRVLRDGASALTKSGERPAAIGLLRQAVVLDPRDLATHRRLAAALALAGDTDASVQEYARFIRDLRDGGASDRVKNELAYAKGQLRGVSGVSTLDAIANGEPAVADATDTEEATGGPTRFSEREAGSALRPQVADEWSPPRPKPAPAFTPPPPAATSADDPWAAPPPTTYPRGASSNERRESREITLENDPWAALRPPSAPSWSSPEVPATERPLEEAAAPSPEPVEAEPFEAAPAEAQAEEIPTGQAQPGGLNGEPAAVETDPIAVEAEAALYLGTRDPRAAAKALEAARYYVKEGYLDAASDLLLQLIAAGVAEHDAQRLLVDIVRTLGKREVAKTKCQLLAHALLLDGRNELAAEVEALALAD